MTTLHEFLDCHYGVDGDAVLTQRLERGADVNGRQDIGEGPETPLHVATRRRRRDAVQILLDHGADINAKTAGGKTAFGRAIRRSFIEVANLLSHRGADTTLAPADQFAVAVVGHDLDEARRLLAQHPDVIKTGNPEEDRLLADVAGRPNIDVVAFLIETGADLTAPALDNGAPLHQAAWFGQPTNAELLVQAGAPLEIFDKVHQSSPVGWAVHGSRYSGGADVRQDVYLAIVEMLLAAGAKLHYPHQPDDNAYFERLLQDATSGVKEVLLRYGSREHGS